jgi:hypothetical protein
VKITMKKINKGLFWTVVASESIHVFCCVLPTIFSVMSLMAGLGMIATMPGLIDEAHHMIHEYEIPMMIVSGFILFLGWIIYGYSRFLSCSDEGSTCCHEPCAPKKDRTKIFMIVATILFIVNVSIYFIFHAPMDEHAVHFDETSVIINHNGHEDDRNNH